MKYIISESKLEQVISKNIKRTLGEYRELHGDERYNPPPFELHVPFDYGFYKDGGYTAAMIRVGGSVVLIIEESYINMIKTLFGLKDRDARDMIANVVKEYIHPYDIRRISIK